MAEDVRPNKRPNMVDVYEQFKALLGSGVLDKAREEACPMGRAMLQHVKQGAASYVAGFEATSPDHYY